MSIKSYLRNHWKAAAGITLAVFAEPAMRLYTMVVPDIYRDAYPIACTSISGNKYLLDVALLDDGKLRERTFKINSHNFNAPGTDDLAQICKQRSPANDKPKVIADPMDLTTRDQYIPTLEVYPVVQSVIVKLPEPDTVNNINQKLATTAPNRGMVVRMYKWGLSNPSDPK
jgi:hypothetical protein